MSIRRTEATPPRLSIVYGRRMLGAMLLWSGLQAAAAQIGSGTDPASAEPYHAAQRR